MNLPGFTAEASLTGKGGNHFSPQVMSRKGNWSPVQPTFLAAIHRIPLPFPPIDACSACISDCVHRGGNSFSCSNLCSFLCY